MLQIWCELLGDPGYKRGPESYKGYGLPTISAPLGSIYLRLDGSGSYINIDGKYTWSLINGPKT